MKTRAEIKAQAMRGFTSRYWPVVGINLLGGIIITVMGYIPAAGWLLSLLVGTIIMVGINGFFIKVYRGNEVKVDNLFEPFSRYGRVLGGSLWMYLWLFIWALIFFIPFIVIAVVAFAVAVTSIGLSTFSQAVPNIYGGMSFMTPGYWTEYANKWNSFGQAVGFWWLLLLLLLIPVIIKSLSYFCTQYILADAPNVGATEALSLSQKMMSGYKWQLFVLGLTFIGWAILSALTFGILLIFFTGPYMGATFAGFYDEVKQSAKQRGIAGAELL